MTSPMLAEISTDGLRRMLKQMERAYKSLDAATTILESEGYIAHHPVVLFVQDLQCRFENLWETALEEFFDSRAGEWEGTP